MESIGAEAGASAGHRRWLPWAGIAIGAWAILPPYSGPALNTAQRAEVADHVVPGVVVLLVAGAALVARRQRANPVLMLAAGMVVTLAGIWMTSTHVPLVGQALRDTAPWGGTLYHTLPALVVLVLGVVWAASYWAEAPSTTSPP